MTEQEITSLPSTVTVKGVEYRLISTGSGKIRYATEDGRQVEFEDRDLATLIRNSRQQ